MYYFVYYINTIALYWKEKPTSLTNKNKEIDNSPIKIAQWVNAEGPKWKNALNHDYKNNYGRNFQCTIFSFIDFVWNAEKNRSVCDPREIRDRTLPDRKRLLLLNITQTYVNKKLKLRFASILGVNCIIFHGRNIYEFQR